MKNFPHQLVITQDPSADQDVTKIGFVFQGIEVVDPCTSSCGRFLVEPFVYDLDYEPLQQLQQLNEVVTAATDLAIQQAAASLNQYLKLGSHIQPGTFFDASSAERKAIWNSIAAYAVSQVNAVNRTKTAMLTPPFEQREGARVKNGDIEFVLQDRAPLQGVLAWWNASPLARGQICVFGVDDNGPSTALWVESSWLNIRIFNLEGACLTTFAVEGRTGLNALYESLVGYKPDDECFEPDSVKLLSLVCEMAYRHATGDDL